VSGHGLDTEIRGSCGHLWTLRHVACPQCFAELKTRLAELEPVLQRIQGAMLDHGGRSVGLEDLAAEVERKLIELEDALADEQLRRHRAEVVSAFRAEALRRIRVALDWAEEAIQKGKVEP